MRIAIVNNGSEQPERLMRLVSGEDVKVFDRIDAKNVDVNAFDVVILSGASQYPVVYNTER